MMARITAASRSIGCRPGSSSAAGSRLSARCPDILALRSVLFRRLWCENRGRAPQPAGQEQSGGGDKPGTSGQGQPQRREIPGAVINNGDELDPDRADAERQQELGAEGGGPPL